MLVPEDQIWMVVVGFIVAFVLAFGIGANDVANSFGTSVGSKVLSLKQACILATIFEMLGAVLLGAKVSTTIRKGIVSIELFQNSTNGPELLMAGQVAALSGSCLWLLVATFFRVPVSGTHSIVGATVGFSLVIFGKNAVNWYGLLKIILSWFVSPAMSGLASIAMFYLLRFLVLKRDEPLEPGLRILPLLYAVVVVVNCFSIFYDGPTMLYFDRIPLYGVFILSFGLGCVTLICVKLFVVPVLRRRILSAQIKPGISKFVPPIDALKLNERLKFPVGKQNTPTSTSAPSSTNSAEYSLLSKPSSAMAIEMTPQRPMFTDNRTHAATGNGSSTTSVDTTQQVHSWNLFPHPPSGPQRRIHRDFEISSIQEKDEKSADTVDTSDLKNRPPLPPHTVAPTLLTPIGEESEDSQLIKDRPAEARVFSFVQILTAIFGSFAHGGNDVSNAIGPLIGLWLIGTTQVVDSKVPTPIWILCYGGLGISIGLWIWGRRVIQTMGEDLTTITPSSGVCIELGSALTVLIASNVGIPISTTHCKVGSVVFVGRARSRDNVNWRIFVNILIAWLVTLPAAGGLAALLMFGFTYIV